LPQAREKGRICHCRKNLAGILRPKLLVRGEGKTVAFLLFCIGVFALAAGLVMIGFGVPINEFSFGNTLISAGTTAAVGGLIIIGLGMTVRQLRRIAEALDVQSQGRFGQPIEGFEGGAGPHMVPAQGRVPFPPRPKSEPHPVEMAIAAAPAAMPAEDHAQSQSLAPKLRNPDESPLTVEDEISLSPQQPAGAPASTGADLAGPARPAAAPSFGSNEPSIPAKSHETAPGWRMSPPPIPPAPPAHARPPQTPNFDAMWPAEAKPPKGPAAGETKAEPPKRAEPEAQKPRAVAILKSGVVDGMGYTLYVDGSIEAELPQGTLRFASINELRSHLEKNS
jgi:hypothetical protein